MGQDIIPYGKHEVREEDINEVVDVLRNEYLAQGSKFLSLKVIFANLSNAIMHSASTVLLALYTLHA